MAQKEFNFAELEKLKTVSRYERRLEQLKSEGKETSNIEDVVNKSMENLKNSINSFIIYGDPQCGKTEMMIVLTAKLLDEGKRVVIVLVTDNVSLLQQNLDRFRNSGINPSPKNFDEVIDENVKIEDGNWIIFCKKNASNLKNLNRKLKGIDFKVVIDDEADSATPNSRINYEERSRINELTAELLGKKSVYIGVTATPARLDLNNTHNNQNTKWIRFEPHKNYNGPDTFFPIDSKSLNYNLKFLPDDDPKHIIDALFSFMINVAHLNLEINKKQEQNYTFLIHTSGRIADHSRDHDQIIRTFTILADSSDKEKEQRKDYYARIWSMAKERYDGEEEKIVSYIRENNQRNNIVVMNSATDFKTKGPSVIDPSTLFTVVMGGNIISRGVTFNNLLSMFFTRTVKTTFHQDTYIQRARMFGSRGNYLKYFELSIPKELYINWHNSFMLHRLSLESIKNGDGAPVWLYGGNVRVTTDSSIDRTTVKSENNEIHLPMFKYDEKVIFNILNKCISNLDKLTELSKVIGKNALPEWLLNFIKRIDAVEGKESIRIHKPMIPKWSDVNLDNLSRPKGFISTSSSSFKDFKHHIQIIYNKDNKARIVYKPSSDKLGFMENIKWL